MSEVHGVYAAIVNVMSEIGATGIAKSRNNQQQGYKFRGIDDVYNELNGILAKNSLVMLPRVMSRSQIERQTKSGGTVFYTTLEVEFTLVSAADGSSTTISTVGEAMDSGDKSSNKAMAAAYKYAAMMVFCIPTEGDNDADGTTHDLGSRPTKTATRSEFHRLCVELEPIATWDKLQVWQITNQPAIDGLNPDLKATFKHSLTAKELRLDLADCKDAGALAAWLASAKPEIDALPDDQKDTVRTAYALHNKSLTQKEAA